MCSPVLVGCCAYASFKSYDRSSNIGLQLGSYRSVTRILKTLCIQNDEILVNECMNYKPFLFTNPYLFADAAPLKWLLEPEQKKCFHWNTWRVHLQVAYNSRPLSMGDLALMVEIPLSMRFQNPSDVQQGSTQKLAVFWSIFWKHGEDIVINMRHLQKHPPVVFFQNIPHKTWAEPSISLQPLEVRWCHNFAHPKSQRHLQDPGGKFEVDYIYIFILYTCISYIYIFVPIWIQYNLYICRTYAKI